VAVNATLEKLSAYGGRTLEPGNVYYLSSSEVGGVLCWHIDYSGHFASNDKRSSNKLHVRPSINF